MNKVILTVMMITFAAAAAFAQEGEMFGTPEGDWSIRGGRLTQENSGAPRAKVWMRVPQEGSVVYEFTMRYEGGAEDGHGGAGIHILADAIPPGISWGMGDSWLLWLNYDEAPSAPGVPRGLSAQLYRSESDISMEIVKSVSLESLEPALADMLDSDIPIKLTFLADRGEVFITDPLGTGDGWYVELPGSAGMSGRYAAVRTNGVRVSFTTPSLDLQG